MRPGRMRSLTCGAGLLALALLASLSTASLAGARQPDRDAAQGPAALELLQRPGGLELRGAAQPAPFIRATSRSQAGIRGRPLPRQKAGGHDAHVWTWPLPPMAGAVLRRMEQAHACRFIALRALGPRAPPGSPTLTS